MEGTRAKKRAKKRANKISLLPELKEDRISLLPEELLHRILCSPSLSQKEATRTCVLSRAWRYVSCTRPKIEWTDFMSHAALNRILKAYRRRNLRLDEFSLELSVYWQGKEALFLRKWIPIIVQNMRVKTLRLDTGWLAIFELPSLIIESDHIQNLSLQNCLLKSSLEVRVSLQRLQTLRLERVDIPEDILNSILSNCPFLEDVTIWSCEGFKRIKLFINNTNNKPTKPTHFSFDGNFFPRDDVSIEIGDDSQTHTSIDIDQCKPLESAHRRRLSLAKVHLLAYSFSCSFTILELYEVNFTEKIVLDNILSYCPSIKNVSLKNCKGFKTIKMLNNTPTRNLQHFCFHGDNDHRVSIKIGNNIETLRSIRISQCLFSVSHNKRLKCASLTRLSLTRVQLSSKSFWCNLHSLEELKLDECSGIKEFKLSSRSMKRLVIHNICKPFKAAIDAPSMVSFQYQGVLPQSISFSTTCSDNSWKSRIILGSSIVGHNHCFNELYDLLKALSQSELTLELSITDIPLGTQLHASVLEEASKHELPLAVEHLRIKRIARKARSSADAFLNMLFRMFRPSFVYLFNTNKTHREMAELVFKKRELAQCYVWQCVLEGVDLEVKYHRKQKNWQTVEHTNFTDLNKKGADGGKLKYRIHLKWRD